MQLELLYSEILNTAKGIINTVLFGPDLVVVIYAIYYATLVYHTLPVGASRRLATYG